MEHISETLKDLRANSPSTTPNQKNYNMIEPSGGAGETMVEKLERFGLSSLEHTFANFKPVPGTEEAVKLMKEIAEGESDRKFVLLYGTTGCGKTYLIEAVIITWLKKNIPTGYQTLSQMVRYLKRAFQAGSIPPYDVLFEQICKRNRLVLDDVGMGTIESKWEIAVLEDIINERYHRRYYPDGKITILATNKDIIELPDRIVSRFYDPEFGAVVHIKAGDYRMKKQVKK
jgi:DNA replication protein DnaC